jgi:hypothetical protein
MRALTVNFNPTREFGLTDTDLGLTLALGLHRRGPL